MTWGQKTFQMCLTQGLWGKGGFPGTQSSGNFKGISKVTPWEAPGLSEKHIERSQTKQKILQDMLYLRVRSTAECPCTCILFHNVKQALAYLHEAKHGFKDLLKEYARLFLHQNFYRIKAKLYYFNDEFLAN